MNGGFLAVRGPRPDEGTDRAADRAVDALLAGRAPSATLCPSEVARALAASGGDGAAAWREAMPAVHAAVDRMVGDGVIRLSWKGVATAVREGPYRIGRAER